MNANTGDSRVGCAFESSKDLSIKTEQHEQASTLHADQMQDTEELKASRRINRKMDIALLPFLSLLYLFNGLDRSNVGNAETQGLFAHLCIKVKR